jgi:hypothetical protein
MKDKDEISPLVFKARLHKPCKDIRSKLVTDICHEPLKVNLSGLYY